MSDTHGQHVTQDEEREAPNYEKKPLLPTDDDAEEEDDGIEYDNNYVQRVGMSSGIEERKDTERSTIPALTISIDDMLVTGSSLPGIITNNNHNNENTYSTLPSPIIQTVSSDEEYVGNNVINNHHHNNNINNSMQINRINLSSVSPLELSDLKDSSV